jgi:hypothetical protein
LNGKQGQLFNLKTGLVMRASTGKPRIFRLPGPRSKSGIPTHGHIHHA